MNLTILLIAAYLPLLLVIFMILRSGAFGKGSIGTLLKLFFFGAASAVLAFLMEAGCLFVINIILGLFSEDAFGGNLVIIDTILNALIASALVEEGWKHFVLRKTTWEQMTMETTADGVAASAVVGAGFSAVLYGAWQAAYYLIPADMESLRNAMPAFLRSGAVTAFIFAILFSISHFGYSGLMGAFYGVAKKSQEKEHGKRAGFMLFFSFLLPVLAHGFCASVIYYGIEEDSILWLVVGFAAEVLLAMLMAWTLSDASDATGDAAMEAYNKPVDFADSEDFADFAASSGAYGDDSVDSYESDGSDREEEAAAENLPAPAEQPGSSGHSPEGTSPDSSGFSAQPGSGSSYEGAAYDSSSAASYEGGWNPESAGYYEPADPRDGKEKA